MRSGETVSVEKTLAAQDSGQTFASLEAVKGTFGTFTDADIQSDGGQEGRGVQRRYGVAFVNHVIRVVCDDFFSSIIYTLPFNLDTLSGGNTQITYVTIRETPAINCDGVSRTADTCFRLDIT